VLTDRDIVKHCDSRVLRRARNIIRAAGSVYDRTCKYEPGSVTRTHLHADVKSSGDWRTSYDVVLDLDESKGRVIGYDCTCPSANSYSGMCKHVAATALIYLEHPETFIGYDLNRDAGSSDGVQKLLKSLDSKEDRLSSGDEEDSEHEETEQPGAIELGVTLVHDTGKWLSRFRISGSAGRYMVKNPADLVDHVKKETFFSYGAKLGFTHHLSMFTPHARKVLSFLERAIDIRRELERDQLSSFHVRPSDAGRDFLLSTPELVELLGLFSDRSLYVDDLARLDHKPRKTRIIDGEPPVRVAFETGTEGGFSISREGEIVPIEYAGEIYIWTGGIFYHCDKSYGEVLDFLRDVYCNPVELQYISESDAPLFCAAVLPALERHLEIEEPEQMRALRPRSCEVLVYLDREGKTCVARAYARYDDEQVDLFEEKGKASPLKIGLRDERAESRARSVLARYFPVVEGHACANEEHPLRLADSEDIARLLFAGIADLSSCATVFTTESFDAFVSKRRPHVSVGLSIKSDLIDLTVHADDLPQKELAALLSSYRLRKRYHRMENGQFIDMDGLDLGKLDEMVEELSLTQDDLAKGEALVPTYRAFQLDSLLADAEKDASFTRYVDNFSEPKKKSYKVPASLAHVLRPYQVEGFNWLNMLCDMNLCGILADEMGLGKSVQLISLLVARLDEQRKIGPNLIVCPASLVYNWVEEFSKFAPELSVLPIAGNKEERAGALEGLAEARENGDGSGAPDVLITSYDLLKRDLSLYEGLLFYTMTLDEAQYIKNHSTLAAQAVKSVDSVHRFALTGTPIENRLSELWSIFDFLMPGFLGPYQRFRENFEAPILEGDDQAMERLRSFVGNFVLRRLKNEVLTDLPDKSESVVYAQMEDEQLRLYRAHEQRLRQMLSSSSDREFSDRRFAVLAELMQLRELCCDPRLVYEDYEGSSAKLDAIIDLVSSALDSGAKMLVFSQFTSYLDLIAERLDDAAVSYYTITGVTPKKRRVELVNAFNEDATPVFLVSLKAGGTGLNLTGASIVVHADPWWNAAAENQATDRAHRIGQTRDVMVYKMIAKGTIEERIVKLQEAKSALADRLVGSDGSTLSNLTREDLISLLEG
jgi:hypothetical protein